MLENCLFESSPENARSQRRKKPFTLAMSTIVHVVIAGTLILFPLLQTQAVPPIALPPPPPMLSAGPPVRIIKLASTSSSNRTTPRPVAPVPSNDLIAPTAIPEKVAYVADAIDIGALDNLRPFGSSDGPGGGYGPIGTIGIPFASTRPTAAEPPAPPQPPPIPPAPKFNVKEPIRVASTLQTSRLLKRVEPVYPSLARTAGVEGTVIAEARITKDGVIDSLRIISGHPLLKQSVIDAVSQWRYQPTIMNGEPIDVITTITVNFKLSR